jgi:hypothetical protein
MDDEQWLRRLLEASEAVLQRLRSDPQGALDLVADVEAFRLEMERRLSELRRDSES